MSTTTPKKTEVGEEVRVAAIRVAVPSKMTAAVLYGSEDLRIEEIDVPSLAVDEVLLRVRLALTDGTDLKVWRRGYHAKMIQPPAVFGHELVGEIVAVGKRVDLRWRVGMRVVAANSAPCLRCYHCRRGQENLCDNLLFNNGAYAEYMRIPGRIVVENMLEVPHSVDDQSAALFVTNVLNGTVAANGAVVKQGTVVRVNLSVSETRMPFVDSLTVVGAGFSERTDPGALVIGPTGVALSAACKRDEDDCWKSSDDDDAVLYVADSLNNRIAVINRPFTRTTPSVNGCSLSSSQHRGGASKQRNRRQLAAKPQAPSAH